MDTYSYTRIFIFPITIAIKNVKSRKQIFIGKVAWLGGGGAEMTALWEIRENEVISRLKWWPAVGKEVYVRPILSTLYTTETSLSTLLTNS